MTASIKLLRIRRCGRRRDLQSVAEARKDVLAAVKSVVVVAARDAKAIQ